MFLIRNTKKAYNQNLLSNAENPIKAAWNVIHTLSGKRSTSKDEKVSLVDDQGDHVKRICR